MRSFRVVAGQSGFPSQFDNLRHDARGGSFLSPHQQLGALALPTTPTNGQTITLVVNGNSIPLTAVTGTPTNPGDIKAPGTAAAFAANVLALLNQPQTTTANGVALSAIEQQLLSYLSFSLVGTTITFSSANNSIFAPLSSLTASTTVTGASWTAQTMQLYVEPGVTYVTGTRVLFTGASTPTVTAPSTNPRIDVLTIDSTGTLAWTTGTENASPSAPAYPANKVALCELYNVVGETALYDLENQTNGQGYIYNDVRSFLQPSMNWTAFTSDLIPDADGTRNLGSATKEFNNIYAKTAVFVNGIPVGSGKFGGTGADGALSISSGTTTIDCANAAVVLKNYTTISITGTGKLAFINPNANGTVIILKSQGGVTLTSSAAPMIDASAMGAAGGAALTFSTGGSSTATGNPGNSGFVQIVATNPGQGGSATGGPPGTAVSTSIRDLVTLLIKYPLSWVGAGAGSGGVFSQSGSSATSGAGGNGGGGLIIECAGAWNFTTSAGISVAGANGTNGTTTNSTNATGAGGGGGAGGFFLALYGSLTANSGTVTVSAGSGGNATGSTSAGGGGGGSNAHALGSVGTTGNAGAKTGGDGAAGLAIVAQNTEYS